MFKYEGSYRSIIFFNTGIVELLVYSGKFKLFMPHYARAKKFEFALINHLFDYSSVKKKLLTNNRPHI